MAEILSFKRPVVEPVDPHLQGAVVCAACAHEWQGVSPVGTAEGLECPSCHTMKGTFKEFCALENFDSVWTCSSCSSTLMRAYLLEGEPGLMCAGCGTVHNALDLFPESP